MALPIRSYSLNNLLMIIFSLMFIIIIGCLSFIQYSVVADDKSRTFITEIENTDLILNHSVNVLYEALNLYDSRYDYEMEMALKKLSDRYLESDYDINALNLSAYKDEIKSMFPGYLDLYIINSENTIERSTLQSDIGLNFSQFLEFSANLNTIRNGDRFVPDQWVDSVNTPGAYRKYAYIPTSDHRYVLEIGIYSDEFWDARRKIFSYDKLGRELSTQNSDLLAVTFFNRKGEPIDERPGRKAENASVSRYIPYKLLKSEISRVFREKNSTTVNDGNLILQYLYLPSRDQLSPSSNEMNLVAALVFSRDNLEKDLIDYRLLHIGITGFALLISLIFSLYISRYISRPLELIIHDIEKIAGGDFGHSIRITGGGDIDRLGRSIDLMVRRILKDIDEIQKSHATAGEELDRRRMAEEALILANTKLNNLSRINRHDILNQVTCIRGYAYLAENADNLAEAIQYTKDIQRISHQIEDMIAFARDYHLIGVTESSWQDLNDVISHAISKSFEGRISLTMPLTHVSILADSLLQKVFYNLVDNSLVHGGPGAEMIEIRFESTGDTGVIIYLDAGCGIPDTEKERIFIRGVGSGSGLGLFLIREILEVSGMSIRETGLFGSGARFEISVPSDQFRIRGDDHSLDDDKQAVV